MLVMVKNDTLVSKKVLVFHAGYLAFSLLYIDFFLIPAGPVPAHIFFLFLTKSPCSHCSFLLLCFFSQP